MSHPRFEGVAIVRLSQVWTETHPLAIAMVIGIETTIHVPRVFVQTRTQ